MTEAGRKMDDIEIKKAIRKENIIG